MNATNTHTPGPWTYGWEGAHTEPTLGRPCVGTTGAADWVGPYGAEADARLIAASPTMKALIEEYVAGIGSICGANNREAKFLEDIEDKARAILKTLA